MGFWLGIVAVVLFAVIGFNAVYELRAIRVVLHQMLASLAESNWRIRDELTEIKKAKQASFH
jgi:hypothetical protein